MKSHASKSHSQSFTLIGLVLGMALLTGCPEFGKINQPKVAIIDSIIEVNLEINMDTIRNQGNITLSLPSGWEAIDASLDEKYDNLSADFTSYWWSDGCGDTGSLYWSAYLDSLTYLDSGIVNISLRIKTGKVPGNYRINYELNGPYWSADSETLDIKLVHDAHTIGGLVRNNDNSISWERPISEEVKGFEIIRKDNGKDSWTSLERTSDTTFSDNSDISGIVKYAVRSILSNGKIARKTGGFPIVKILHGDTLFVSPNGDDRNYGGNSTAPLRTISHALEQLYLDSLHSRVIKIASGTYSPSSGERFPLLINQNLTLIGDEESATILDGEMESKLVAIEGATGKLQNLTLVNGLSNLGSAIRIVSGFNKDYLVYSSPNFVLENIVVKNCIGEWGVINCNDGRLSIRNSLIAENSFGVRTFYTDFEMINTTIANNHTMGLEIMSPENIDIQNSILWDDMSLSEEYDFDTTYNYVESNRGESSLSDLGMLEDGSYLLLSESNLVDAGNPSTEMFDRSSNSDSVAPAQGSSRNDLGAYGGPTPLNPEFTGGYSVADPTLAIIGNRFYTISEYDIWNSFYFEVNEVCTWELGGIDAELFEMSGSGYGNSSYRYVRFKECPAFSTPSDANQDNVYVLELTVTNEEGATRTAKIQITLVDQFGNQLMTDEVLNVSSILGIEDEPNQIFSVYPNPVSDWLVLSFPKPIQEVCLFGFDGKQYRVSADRNNQVDLRNIPEARYVIRIISEKEVFSEKIIVKH